MKKLCLLEFKSEEGVFPIQLKEQFIIVTTLSTESEIDQLAQAIVNVKTHADMGESISDFIIPEHWNELAWNVRLILVVSYMEEYTGVFEVIHLFHKKIEKTVY